MRRLYDTHFHLDLQKDKKRSLDEINKNHIYTIAVTNLPELFQKEQGLFDSPYVRLALGFHPELLIEYKHQIPLMWHLLPKAKYVGEVGLDFSNKQHVKEQISFFEELINRCSDNPNKVLSIHSRRSVSTILDIIGHDFSFKPILHWFTGTNKEMEIAIERGYYFSINTSMTKTIKGKELIRHVPKSQILLETDSPFCCKDSQKVSLDTSIDFLDPGDTGFLWQNFEHLLRTSSL